jgi:hypothetical protein
MSKPEKFTLITNLQFVTVRGVRTFCHALLVTENDKGLFGPSYTVRGFGTEGAWPVFDIRIAKEDLPFALAEAHSADKLWLKEDGTAQPLVSGAILSFKSGLDLQLVTATDEKPIDVTHYTEIIEVWQAVWRKTAEYWHMPNMPRLVYGPPSPSGCTYR